MSMMFSAWLYVMSNRPNGTIYVGVTARLIERVAEHKEGVVPGFVPSTTMTVGFVRRRNGPRLKAGMTGECGVRAVRYAAFERAFAPSAFASNFLRAVSMSPRWSSAQPVKARTGFSSERPSAVSS